MTSCKTWPVSFAACCFWKADNVQIAADHGGVSSNVLHVYSNSNVVDGSFTLQRIVVEITKHTNESALQRSENFYKPNYVCVEDRDLIKKYGVQEKEHCGFWLYV